MLEDGQPTFDYLGKLVPAGGTCSFASVDPSFAFDLSRPEVTIDGRRFYVHGEADGKTVALECDPLTSTASAAVKRCSGNAEPCSLLDCRHQAGCSYDIGRADDGSDDRCRGSADDCATLELQSECERQPGCSWS